MNWRRPFHTFAAPFTAIAIAVPAPPAVAQPTETAVKADFIPKFARYVHWPAAALPGPGHPFVLCVIGVDPFGPLLDRAAASEQIEGRGVAVRRHASAEEARGCHFAFVQGATPQDTTRILLALRTLPILTITDARAGPQHGMIHFTVSDGRVRFFVDEAQASACGLTISSRLLALALAVRQRR
jgi:hypothetical protein